MVDAKMAIKTGVGLALLVFALAIVLDVLSAQGGGESYRAPAEVVSEWNADE